MAWSGPLVICFDFDGTTVEHRHPEIGAPIAGAVETLRDLQAAGHRLILWTCRTGQPLVDAMRYLRSHGIAPAAVNANLPELVRFEGSDPRKPYADVYIEDRNCPGGFGGWDGVRQELLVNGENRPRTWASSVLTVNGCKFHPMGTELLAIVRKHQVRAETVVFTNGCFDILNANHINLFRNAKKLGDVLLVAMNSGESIGRLKGPGRPVMTDEERIEVLSAVACVDYLTIFPGDTPHEALRYLKPDMLAKGGDYASIADIVAHEVVEDYGGKVVLLPRTEFQSTSDLVTAVRGPGKSDSARRARKGKGS